MKSITYNTFAIQWWKQAIKFSKPHVQRPPACLEDELDALQMARNSTWSKHYEHEFKGLFLDWLDNKMKHITFFDSMHETLYCLCKVLDIWKWDKILAFRWVGEYLDDLSKLLWVTIEYLWFNEETWEILYDEVSIPEYRLCIIGSLWWTPPPQELVNQCRAWWVLVVEDWTQCHGVVVQWARWWTLWDVGVIPLWYGNMVFSGWWTCVVTNDTLLFDCLQSWKKSDERSVVYLGSYSDWKQSSYHSIIGKYSLRHRNRVVNGSEQCFSYFRKRLESICYLTPLKEPLSDQSQSVSYRYRYIVIFDSTKLRWTDPQTVLNLLQAEWMIIQRVEIDWSNMVYFQLPSFYDRYDHKHCIDQYIAAFRKVQINLFC